MIDAAIGASAHRVIAVTPWYGYSRQDKKSAPREPITARLVARMLEAAGADRVLTMDLHAGQVQGFFQKPVDHMTAMFILTQYFRDLHLEDLVVVSPDAGRVKLAKKFAEKVGRRAGDPQQGAPRPAGRRDRLRDRRREGQDRGHRRRPDRHRGHAARRGRDGQGRGRARASSPCATHGVFSGNAWENLARRAVRGDRGHGHDPDAPRRAAEHPRALAAPTCSRTRSAASSPTTRCPRSSAARTSSSDRTPLYVVHLSRRATSPARHSGVLK